MPATIKDIAKKVGVNPSTVSRVINGTASISEETRQKIKDAMKELDYHPNSLARSLVNGSTFTIGLVIDAGNSDAFSNAFFIRSVSAIEAVTQQRGFNLLITSDSDKEDNSAVKNLILEKKIDGIILPVSAATEELIDLLLGNHFPFIVLGEPDNVRDGIHWIDMDNKQGAEDAVNYLHRMGYEKTILLVENRITMFERKRIQGFQAAIGLNGKDVAENLIVECGVESPRPPASPSIPWARKAIPACPAPNATCGTSPPAPSNGASTRGARAPSWNRPSPGACSSSRSTAKARRCAASTIRASPRAPKSCAPSSPKWRSRPISPAARP